MKNIESLDIDKSWTLFLDRDGVINKRIIDDYVKKTDEFEFLPGVLDAIKIFSEIFGKVVVVTNQRGISRELMTKQDLAVVHNHMLENISNAGGKIDNIYFCPHDRNQGCGCRKPDTGMALQAQKDFSQIDFSKSIMIGDSTSDIEFGQNAGMYTIRIEEEKTHPNSAKSLAEVAEFFNR